MKLEELEQLADGFYVLSNGNAADDCLVKVYTNQDTLQRGIGFGVWDGAGFLPFWDCSPSATLAPVVMSPRPAEFELSPKAVARFLRAEACRDVPDNCRQDLPQFMRVLADYFSRT